MHWNIKDASGPHPSLSSAQGHRSSSAHVWTFSPSCLSVTVYAGIGGISLRCMALGGGLSVAVIEKSHIACKSLRSNDFTVIEGDLATHSQRVAFHRAQPKCRCLLGASLPCQGSSRIGSGSGPADPGNDALHRALQAAWHLQVSGFIFERVPEIAGPPHSGPYSKFSLLEQAYGGNS